ncbi:TolB family protein [Symbioplanes lichenis]|uniref:TolB family protein n=1 Tax=Symbioplanes lichenis TaxID=1629072 RepID=UPI00273860CA|nr:hypothetical protein [Actinoplanes lichenis]
MSDRWRVVAFGAVVAVVLAGAGGYVWHERTRQADELRAAPAVPTRDDAAAVRDAPHLVFRSTALGQGYGSVALVSLDAPDGPRAFTPAHCERVYATGTGAVCLSAERGLVTKYRAQLLDQSWAPVRDLPLTGIPSRTRLSRDGAYAATTTFVFGDSYANPGQFSTRTVVTGAGDLETFALTVDGRRVTSPDRNFWGVTFAGGDRFYATAASGGKTWLVEGSLSRKTMTARHADVECPSLSPDGTRVAYKKHGKLPAGQWRLAVLDLRTGAETLLAETRSVDDQAEWLDDRTVLYGLARAGEGTATSDIWRVPADGSGAPAIFVHDAWSPAVVR